MIMFNLEEAKNTIREKPEFGLYERPYGWVIDYNVTLTDTFIGKTARETQILRNLRGTIFDHSGKIISLPLDKFHNYGECDGWLPEQIDISKPHKVLLKIDGSMCRSIPIGRKFRLGTRAGITDVSDMAEKFIRNSSQEVQATFHDMLMWFESQDATPIFEFCSRENRVVIDYPEPSLTLLAARYRKSGKYFEWQVLERVAQHYNWPLVEVVATESSSLKDLISAVRAWPDLEGIVVAFENGFRVKAKAERYCILHKVVDGLRWEKDVLRMILEETLDDAICLLDDQRKLSVQNYRDSVIHSLMQFEHRVEELYEQYRHLDKKSFAQEASKYPEYRSFMFKLYDGHPPGVREFILKSKTSSQSRVDEIRHLIGRSYYEF